MGTHGFGMGRGLKATSYEFMRLGQKQRGQEQGDRALPLSRLAGVSRRMSKEHLHLTRVVRGLVGESRARDSSALMDRSLKHRLGTLGVFLGGYLVKMAPRVSNPLLYPSSVWGRESSLPSPNRGTVPDVGVIHEPRGA